MQYPWEGGHFGGLSILQGGQDIFRLPLRVAPRLIWESFKPDAFLNAAPKGLVSLPRIEPGIFHLLGRKSGDAVQIKSINHSMMTVCEHLLPKTCRTQMSTVF